MSIVALTDLKKNLISFIDEIIELCPSESDFVLARILLKDQIPIQEVANVMIQTFLPLKEMIKKRDEKALMSLSFGIENQGRVSHLKKLWMSSNLDDDSRETIWAWLDAFVVLVERYQKALLKESGAK